MTDDKRTADAILDELEAVDEIPTGANDPSAYRLPGIESPDDYQRAYAAWWAGYPHHAAPSAQRAYMRRSPTERARKAVHQAVKSGRLKRPQRCSGCRRLGYVEAHHEDYSRPLVVVWLCQDCHNQAG